MENQPEEVLYTRSRGESKYLSGHHMKPKKYFNSQPVATKLQVRPLHRLFLQRYPQVSLKIFTRHAGDSTRNPQRLVRELLPRAASGPTVAIVPPHCGSPLLALRAHVRLLGARVTRILAGGSRRASASPLLAAT